MGESHDSHTESRLAQDNGQSAAANNNRLFWQFLWIARSYEVRELSDGLEVGSGEIVRNRLIPGRPMGLDFSDEANELPNS